MHATENRHTPKAAHILAAPTHQSPEVRELLDKYCLRDRTKSFVTSRRDCGYAQRPHAALQELCHDEAMITAADFQ